MTYEELITALKGKGYNFSIDVEEVGPTNEFTEAEQEEQCCGPVDTDECADDGKVEPWSGWSEEDKEVLGDEGGVTVQELFQLAEQRVGAGNVHLSVKLVGPAGNCGTKETEWDDSLGCCKSPDELLKSSGFNSVTIGNTYDFSVTGGEPQVSWQVIGEGVEVSGTNMTASVYINGCFCKPAVLYAQDACESVAPWILSASDGSWASIADTELSSPFGWFQDGTSGHFYVIGFNGDYTQVSTQYFFEAGEWVGTEEVVCGTSFPGINTSPIVTPQDSQGFTKCDSSNVWIRLKEGYTDVWDVRHAIDNQGTSEYTPGVCDEELLYNSADSADVITPGGSASVTWEGGIAPYTVDVQGEDAWLDAAHTVTTIKTPFFSAEIYAGADSCTVTVTVRDACGDTVTGYIRANGSWVQYGDDRYIPDGVPEMRPDNVPQCCTSCMNTYWCYNGSGSGCWQARADFGPNWFAYECRQNGEYYLGNVASCDDARCYGNRGPTELPATLDYSTHPRGDVWCGLRYPGAYWCDWIRYRYVYEFVCPT